MQILRTPDRVPSRFGPRRFGARRFGNVALLVLGVILLTGLVLSQPVMAEDSLEETDDKVVFVPPPIGAPADRITAGTRSAQAPTSSLVFLSPKAGGLTANPQPTLYWYLPHAYRGTLDLAVTEVAADPQIANGAISVDLSKGLYALNFNQINFSLRSGQIYLVTLDLSDANQGPMQSSTYVEVVDLDVNEEETIASFAKRGLWFDAVDAGMRTAASGRASVIDDDKMLQLFYSAGVAAPWID